MGVESQISRDLFEVDWKVPCHHLLVKFLITYQIKEDTIMFE
jgi:hypothetical protein